MTVAAVQQPARDVVLIDLSALVHQAWHASADQPLSIVFEGTLASVRRCVNYRPGALIAIACDSKTNWRKDLAPSYKIHREKREASFYDCFDRVKARLRADGFLLLEAAGYEADDLVATATDAAVVAGHPVVICSADKDLAVLTKHEGVTMLRTSTWEPLDAAGVEAKFGVPPSQLGDLLALMGDKSDGIEGIEGFGPKTAADLLKAHGSIDGIYDAMKDGTIALKGKKLDALNAGIETLELARKLVALKYDAPIRFEEIYEERKQEPITKEIPPMPEAEAEYVDTIISKPPAKADAGQATLPLAAVPSMPEQPSLPSPPQSLATLAQSPPQQALAVIPQPFELSLEPQSPGQAVNLSARLHNARLYPWLANEDQVLAVITRGREAGLPACIALDVFRPVQGRICAIWQFIVDRAQRDKTCEYLYPVEVTESFAIWEGKHSRNPGPPTRLKVTIEEMRKTGLVKEDKKESAWMARPSQMLSKECALRLSRMLWPGATSGLYAPHELGGDE